MTLFEWLLGILDSPYAQPIVITVVTAVIGRIAWSRGKLIWGVSHTHFYQMPRFDDGGSFPVRTQQIWFNNPRINPIEDIEIILNWKPQHFEIWNPRFFTYTSLPDGRFVISVPNLAGAESFTLSMIDTIEDIPQVINVRFKNGLGRFISMVPQQVFPKWVVTGLALLALIGFATAINFLFAGATLVLKPTP